MNNLVDFIFIFPLLFASQGLAYAFGYSAGRVSAARKYRKAIFAAADAAKATRESLERMRDAGRKGRV